MAAGKRLPAPKSFHEAERSVSRGSDRRDKLRPIKMGCAGLPKRREGFVLHPRNRRCVPGESRYWQNRSEVSPHRQDSDETLGSGMRGMDETSCKKLHGSQSK